MIKVILCGASGRMGGFVADTAAADSDISVVAGIDKINNGDINVKADMIIDFSHPSMLEPMLEYAVKNNIPVVIATTGYDNAQTEKIRAAAKKIPIFFTFNMSLGINLVAALAKKAAAKAAAFSV